MTKFSIQIENQFGYSWNQIREIVERAEKWGYHSFYICDHFFLDKNSETRDALEAWTVLTAAAMVTKRIKLGTLVTGNNYRNPALLAKIAATLDNISGGRMEFGIGAGWKEVEYTAYGYEFPPLKERMDRLEEALQVVKMLWKEARSTFHGRYYQLEDAVFSPKPVQDNPVILVGGGGERRTFRMVAKYADYMNLPFTPIDKIQRKLDALKDRCKEVGRDYEDVGKSIFYPIWVGESEEEVGSYIRARATRAGIPEKEMRERIFSKEHPGSWIGTPEQVRDRIEYMNSLGFDYYFIQQPFDLSGDGVDKFAELVMNKYFR